MNITTDTYNSLPLQFKIPISNHKLCEQPVEPNVFWVQDRLNVGQWKPEKLQEQIESVMAEIQRDPFKIISNQDFDVLYSILFFIEDVSINIRKEVIQLLASGLKGIVQFLDRKKLIQWGEQNFMSASTVNNLIREVPSCEMAIKCQNSLSAYIYLITWFLSDNCRLKEYKEANITKGKKKVAKKDKTKDQENDELAQNSIALASQDALREIMEGVLQKDIHVLWLDQQVDENFIKCLIRASFDLLENHQQLTKDADLKQTLFDILHICMDKYGKNIRYMQSSNIQKIIDLLYNQDNMAKPMAEFVGLVVERQGPQIANDIIRDLTKQIFHTDSSHETIGIKNIGKFLSKLSKKVPKAVYGNVGSLLGFFDCEAYLLRQSLIKILRNTIIYVLNPKEIDQATGQNIEQQRKVQEIYMQTKQKFLELLMKRFMDKSAFCRKEVIKAFTRLTEENLVPPYNYMELFQAVIGRLKDAAVLVRKSALNLYQQLICIYALIFRIDVMKGQKFPTMEQVLFDYEQANKDFENAKTVLDNKSSLLNQKRQEIMVQYPNRDAATLHMIASQDPKIQQAEQDIRIQQKLVDDATTIKGNYFELGRFLTQMDDSGTLLVMMLSLKTQQDLCEVIRVFKLLHKYGLSHTEAGSRKILTLVFREDIKVQEAVIDYYKELFFGDRVEKSEKVKNLLKLMKDATLTDVTCIEELLCKLIKNDTFEKDVFLTLWQTYLKFGRNFESLSTEQSADERRKLIQECKYEQRSAIQILRMAGSHRIEYLIEQKERLYESSLKFAKYESPDFIILKEAVLAYEKIIQYQIKKTGSVVDGVNDNDKTYLFQMISVISNTFGTTDLEWFCACETVLNTLFNIKSRNSHEYAKLFIDQVLRKMFRQRADEEVDLLRRRPENQTKNLETMPLKSDIQDQHYSQLFFIVGHVAIKMLQYVEQCELEIKQSLHESFKKRKEQQKREEGEDRKSQQEDDLAQITGGKEAEVEQYTQTLQDIAENQLLQEGLLGKFTPILVTFAKESLKRYTEPESALRAPQLCILERSAILALCKFMCVSSKVCAQHLDILFGLLQSKIEFGVKANIIISLADLFTKFPNLMNERVKEIFMLLHDKECLVRQQALMVITHLILNDMLKIRGEIVDICMLLEDSDERIRDQVKLFLHELHSKGSHLIYNMFLKAVSRLSKEFEHLQKSEFENIARNLMNYIKQDKQTETLIEKLCLKLKNSTLPTEWRNTAYCISQLKFTDKIFMKLLELYDCYKERLLQNAEVKEYFLQLVQSSKKLMKPEMKQHLEEFELKVNLDENAMLQLKQDNPYASKQEQLAKLKAQKKKARQTNVESEMPEAVLAEVTENQQRKRTRAQMHQNPAQLNQQMQHLYVDQIQGGRQKKAAKSIEEEDESDEEMELESDEDY